MTAPRFIRIADGFRTGMELATPVAFNELTEAAEGMDATTLYRVPGLTTDSVQMELRKHGLSDNLPGPPRRLCGCAVVRNGGCYIFVDTADTEVEKRFTLAHEIAHLLLDYLDPRTKTAELLGDRGEDVFDGRVTATLEEQLAAALRGIHVTPFVHMMERDHRGNASPTVSVREHDADELAREILAPIDDVGSRLWPGWTNDDAMTLLVDEYGLPMSVASDYLPALISRFRPAPSFLDGFLDQLRTESGGTP